MKLFTNKIGILSIALAMTVSSCNKEFLNAVPELDLSDATVFNTPARVLAQVSKSLIKPFICELCNTGFTRSDNLKVHLENRCKVKKEQQHNNTFQ